MLAAGHPVQDGTCMRGTPEQQAVFERFSKKYKLLQAEVMREIERTVCGCDYGATSWTTLEEARIVSEILALQANDRFLDIGSGSGWPGVYLAEQMGCDIAMIDLPVGGLRIARDRAVADQIGGAVWASVADAANLPFRGGSFDAIFHSDVLCCLSQKLDVLKSCRRVVRAEGKMVFSVILIAPGLAEADYERAAGSGPPFIAADAPYPDVLGEAGWDIADHRDLTDDYRATVGHMLEQLEHHADKVEAVFGKDDAAQERARRRATLDALADGHIRRELFSVVPR